MILDDFVMLGTTVPEPNSDGRVFVCSAGLSPEYGKLVRVYPLARRNIPKRWGVYRVPLERNRNDNRDESFKIANGRGREAHEYINNQFEMVRKQVPHRERVAMLAPYAVGSIKEANARSKAAKTPRERFSLAVIHPDAIELDFDHNTDSPESPQMKLFDREGDPPSGAKRFSLIPRLHFRDELGWNHQMLRDWGSFELQRKHGPDYTRRNLASALHLDEQSSLLVGNQNQHRNSWLVIAVLNGIRETPTLFDSLASDRPSISDRLRREVYERDQWRCVRCGDGADLVIDHRLPHSKGGSTTLENLQTLCRKHNLMKSDQVDGAA